MKKKTIGKTLLSAVLTLVLALSMIGGATFALFTSQDETNVAITSGKVDVVATPRDPEVYSPAAIDAETNEIVDDANVASGNTFHNGGTATLEDSTLKLANVSPGDRVTFHIDFTNQSNIKAKYRYSMTSSGDMLLVSGLQVSFGENGGEKTSYTKIAKYVSVWKDMDVATEENKPFSTLDVTVELLPENGNEFSNLNCELTFSIEAVQHNAKVKEFSGRESVPYVEKLVQIFNQGELVTGVYNVSAGQGATFIFGDDIDAYSLTTGYNSQGNYDYIFNINDKKITLDLNTHKLNMTNDYGICATIKENATLTIKNGELNATRTSGFNSLFFVGGQTANAPENNYTDSLILEKMTVNYTTDETKRQDGWSSLIGSNASNTYAASNVTVTDTDFVVTGNMDVAFYLPNKGMRNFINSSVDSATPGTAGKVSTSFFICGGDWNIQGGSYVGNGYRYANQSVKDEATGEYTLSDFVVQKTTVFSKDPMWETTFTQSGFTVINGIVGSANGAVATGDAICIVVRYDPDDARQNYLLGNVTVAKDVKFKIGDVTLTEEEKTAAAVGTVLSGPSGYAVRVYDARPNAARGAISIAAGIVVEKSNWTVKGESANTTTAMRTISLCRKNAEGEIIQDASTNSSLNLGARKETKPSA